ncbi:MAG: bifunctional methylenetetrahydrofolate dehydrogenase/methenyltetrahydrofolate cyclohydrolase, partial [Cyanobacteria bacterium REEB65]|nr:bifunctional methylenetetrahydrofolate dehydrogenase/methenyltetrahydrofolate cyclohydrolase [Cyanobacteria bacterium REEB65]
MVDLTESRARILDGKAAAQEIRQNLRQRVIERVTAGSRPPGLAVVVVGDDPASAIYVRNKRKACQDVGITSWEQALPASASEEDICQVVDALNVDPAVDGILVQLPLPARITSQAILERVHPDKDVDGFHPLNAGRLLLGQKCLAPCTALGILAL